MNREKGIILGDVIELLRELPMKFNLERFYDLGLLFLLPRELFIAD